MRSTVRAIPQNHSPCIINLDDLGGQGTHWVCCWATHLWGTPTEYFDSFGLPPPAEWEIELILEGKKTFLRNDNQLQWEFSVRCGYYCLLFLNERNKGRSFRDILRMFSKNTHTNEAVVKDYFTVGFTNFNYVCQSTPHEFSLII